MTGVDPVTASSSVATCMAGIGPGFGTVGPMSNFAHMPEFSKLVFSLLMIIGRLEIITVFTIFTRTFLETVKYEGDGRWGMGEMGR